MKKIIMSMVIILTAITGTQAMSYQQAREQALFLTDKMAYELNLSEQQYEAAYEINLDYLMSVNTVDDVYATSWRQRNIDLQHILLDWQYTSFCAVSYFFRPLYWASGNWHFGIYAHYPHHNFYYFRHPVGYSSYRGAHSWRSNGGASWYVHQRERFHNPAHGHIGLRDTHVGKGIRREPTIHKAPRQPNRNSHNPSATPRPNTPKSNAMPSQNGRRTYNRESSTRKTVGANNTPSHESPALTSSPSASIKNTGTFRNTSSRLGSSVSPQPSRSAGASSRSSSSGTTSRIRRR